MAKEKIVIIEDDEDILELVRYNLVREGFTVSTALSGEEGIPLTRSFNPDVVILDLMLPGVNGFDVCRILKGEPATQAIPIVMLTAKGEESDIVAGLELGADDYITKPFSVKVLIARIRALLRRKSKAAADTTATIRMGDLEIRPGRHEVLIRGKPVELTYSEFAILHYLASRPGWVFTRYQIVDAVHGEDHPVSDRSVDVQIVGLRKKLGEYGAYIVTVRGVGYRFRE